MLSSPPIQINGKSMSRKYPHQSKREAIGIRQIHDDISFTRYATAVRERALRRWREQLRKKQSSSYVRKNFSVGHKTDTKSACRCKQRRNVPTRRRPPNGWGYPPTPPKTPQYTYCIYTLCQNMGILWAIHGHFTGICSDIRSAAGGQRRRAMSAGCVDAPYVPYATDGLCLRDPRW